MGSSKKKLETGLLFSKWILEGIQRHRLLLLLLLSTSHSILYSCQCPRTGDEGRKPTTAKQKAKTKSKKIKEVNAEQLIFK